MKYKKNLLFTFCLFLIISMATFGEALDNINVVASTLDMADIAKNIGGKHTNVEAISHGEIDLHFFEPRPSHVMKLKDADVLIVGGMELDIWIKALIDASRNPNIRFNALGYVDPSDGIRAIGVPAGTVDASMGDVHPYGNPHYWHDPENLLIAAENIYKGLVRVDPARKEYYLENKNNYVEEIRKRYKAMKAKMRPYRGSKVIQYHASWNYFCMAFDLEIIGELEPKPGIPPTPAHLKEILRLAKEEDARVLLAEPYYSKGPIKFIQRNADIRVLRLPNYLGSNKNITTLLDNVEYSVESIVSALSK